MSLIHPVILSGGAGSRLWPLSRSLFPKQLLALVGEHSLIQDTMLRARAADFAAPLIICNAEHRFLTLLPAAPPAPSTRVTVDAEARTPGGGIGPSILGGQHQRL